MSEPDLVDLRPYAGSKGTVLGTRSLGQRIVAEHSNVNARIAVYLRVDGVRVMTSPVIDELLTAWPRATLLGADKDLLDTWEMVLEAHRRAATSGDEGEPGGTT
jgi:hypothetical protein